MDYAALYRTTPHTLPLRLDLWILHRLRTVPVLWTPPRTLPHSAHFLYAHHASSHAPPLAGLFRIHHSLVFALAFTRAVVLPAPHFHRSHTHLHTGCHTHTIASLPAHVRFGTSTTTGHFAGLPWTGTLVRTAFSHHKPLVLHFFFFLRSFLTRSFHAIIYARLIFTFHFHTQFSGSSSFWFVFTIPLAFFSFCVSVLFACVSFRFGARLPHRHLPPLHIFSWT